MCECFLFFKQYHECAHSKTAGLFSQFCFNTSRKKQKLLQESVQQQNSEKLKLKIMRGRRWARNKSTRSHTSHLKTCDTYYFSLVKISNTWRITQQLWHLYTVMKAFSNWIVIKSKLIKPISSGWNWLKCNLNLVCTMNTWRKLGQYTQKQMKLCSH